MSETGSNSTTVFYPSFNKRAGRSARIIIAGGGTGGHIFPAVAVANALKNLDQNISILFVGAKGKMEMEKVPQAGYKIEGIDISGFNRSSLVKNVSLPFKVIRSFFQVSGILRRFRPDAVFGVGGYSSFPVLRMAQRTGIPTFLHESNAFAGKSNMLLGKRATKIFVSANNMQRFFPGEKIMKTGNPVRRSIAENFVEPAKAKQEFGLDNDKVTVLAMGGSLGAKSINEAVEAGFNELQTNNIQLIWQTGKLYTERAKAVVEKKKGVWVNDFISAMDNAYAAADIVISRSGAMSVAELCITGKPVVFVPYPFAAEDHQTANARALVDVDAAIMINNDDVGDQLIKAVLDLANDASRRMELSKNIKRLALRDADTVIAKTILESI